MKKISVLLVDDHTVVRQGLRVLLQAEGDMEVVGEAENGRQAVRMARKAPPDVVVMDIVMPGRNGFQACRDLKSDERYKNVPVILCTSKSQESDKFWGQQQGANSYLVKPVKAEALLDAIKDVLRQR